MVIAITGVTGNMGQAVFEALKDMKCLDKVTKIRLLCNNLKKMKKLIKTDINLYYRCQLIYGNMTDRTALSQLVDGSDIVINLAAVIPPKSDYNPQLAVDCNDIGVKLLVEEIEKLTRQPRLVHISSVAIYGNRAGEHKFIQVGDPVMPSVFDSYAVTKMRGEWHVLESKINKWVILRQTAMLHKNIFADNIHGGLLFHTVLNSSIEWVTAHDSGVLIANLIDAYYSKELAPSFWKKCYNIAGGKRNRNFGIQTFDNGFSVLGGTTVDFFKPSDIITRNFHCGWYLDGDILEDKFHFQSETVEEFWAAIFRAHPIFKLGKYVPKTLICKFLFDRLKKDSLAPTYWARQGDMPRLTAYFGGKEQYEKLRNTTWKDFEIPDISAISTLKKNDSPVNFGYNIAKPDSEITKADLESVAAAHGGRLVGDFNGDLYATLEWETQDKEPFFASAYTVLRAGHWYNPLYKTFVWDFDRLAKGDKVFASVWYDSHSTDEDITYSYDSNWTALAERTK